MNKIILSLMLLLTAVTTTPATAQEEASPDNYTNEVLDKMLSFFKKGIDEKLYLQLDKPYYSAGDKIWFKGYLRNAISNAPLNYSNFIYVDLVAEDDELISRVKVRRDSTGFNGYINLDAKMVAGNYTLRGYTRWMLNHGDDYIYRRGLNIISPIPPSANKEEEERLTNREKRLAEEVKAAEEATKVDFDLQFLPEGGALIGGSPQIVAFKAVGESGLSTEVSGSIYNSQDKKICDFSTTHKGMGIVTLFVNSSESYYAVAKSDDGSERRVDLPAVSQNGAVITAARAGNKVLFQPRATSADLLDGAHVIINAHGRIVSVSGANSGAAGTITMDQLSDGINIFSLVDRNNVVMSERLIFKRPATTQSISIDSDRASYDSRERVHLKLNISDSLRRAVGGEYAISVTDDSSVELNPANDNIVSYLLLSSDLTGYIEEPGLYFEEGAKGAEAKLDLVMRTHGWSRFDMGDILADNISDPKFQYEGEAEISGRAKAFFGNAPRKAKISVFCDSQSYVNEFPLDESGSFRLTGLNIPDSTTYVVQALGRNGGTSLTLEIDPEVFPEAKSVPFRAAEQIEEEVPISFISQSQDKFFYEGGMNTINLDAITITSQHREEESGDAAFAIKSTGRSELEKLSSASLETVLMSYTGMTVTTEGPFYRGNTVPASFILEGMKMTYNEVTYLTAADIETISYFEGTQAMIYTDEHAGGVFVITLMRGAGSPPDGSTNLVHVSQLGYQRPERHYQPNYAVPSLKRTLPPDYRTTIYWDWALTPDKDGEMDVEFYTADKATNYTVTVEGISNSGEIYRATHTIERR